MLSAEEREMILRASSGRVLIIDSAVVSAKSTRDTAGVAVMTQKRGARLISMRPFKPGDIGGDHRYRTRTLPAAGALPREEDVLEANQALIQYA